jgi:hypothetical protein
MIRRSLTRTGRPISISLRAFLGTALSLGAVSIGSISSYALTATHVAPPSISSFLSSSKLLDQFGGPVTLHATLRDSKTCSLSVKPELSGFPFNDTCAHSSYTHSIVLPQNLTSRAIAFVFTLDATGHGTKRAATTVTENAIGSNITASWSGVTPIEELHGVPSAVSCPSTTVCYTVDDNGYVTLHFIATTTR